MSELPDVENRNEIADLNILIADHLKGYVGEVDLRFDEPNPDDSKLSAAFHLFMYLIHEDLSVRHSISRQYDASAGTWNKEKANICCLYLVTYWGSTIQSNSDSRSPGASPDSEAIMNMSAMIRGLVAMRRAETFKKYNISVIQPEALNSLGNFWQALGNKPRTIINFAVTLPMSLEPDAETSPPVTKIESEFTELQENKTQFIEEVLRQTLRDALGHKVADIALKKIVFSLEVTKTTTAGTSSLTILIAGITYPASAKDLIEAEVKRWKDKKVEFTVGPTTYSVSDAKCNISLPYEMEG